MAVNRKRARKPGRRNLEGAARDRASAAVQSEWEQAQLRQLEEFERTFTDRWEW